MNVYEARHAGREYCCDTEGSDHYKEGGIEPMDLFIAKGTHEDFCIDNIVKYAMRFKETRNLKDLRKASDYSHILCGVELLKDACAGEIACKSETEIPVTESKASKWDGMSNEKLRYRVCERITCEYLCSSKCPIPNIHNSSLHCDDYVKQHPDEARQIMLAFLEGREKAD